MLVGYHGTTARNAECILNSGRFRNSAGDRHWLGDGIYFFSEELHAYIWNRDHYRSRNQQSIVDIKLLLRKYAILAADIRNDRMFDLDTAEHKIMFERAYAMAYTCMEEVTVGSQRSCAEGVILNLMFEHMGFADEYDLVTATFANKAGRYRNLPMKSRLAGIPQRQICVKNAGVIGNIVLDEIGERANDLEKQARWIYEQPPWNYAVERKSRYDL